MNYSTSFNLNTSEWEVFTPGGELIVRFDSESEAATYVDGMRQMHLHFLRKCRGKEFDAS